MDKKTFRIIEQYVSLLKTNNFIIEKAVLFGSFAKNKNTNDSDIDIAVVSKDFQGLPIMTCRKSTSGGGR